nr:hypothetical protein [Tanacetum cinerariifolium]
MPMVVPVSTREPKCIMNQSVAKPHRRTVASESTNQKPRNKFMKLYEHVSKACSWWYPKFTPPGYKWKPKSKIRNAKLNLVEIFLFIVDSGCSKHMTGNLKLLINFVEKFLGTIKFGNDQIAPILGYEDLVQGSITIKRVYYVEGLNHNLFSVGQFYDADLEVAFRKSTCYIRDLKGNDPLIDETPKVLINFLRLVQRGLHAKVRTVRTDKGTEFLNKTLHAYFAAEGIKHQMSVAQTPEQNGVVERRNRTRVEAARTMLSAVKVPLYFWAEAIATSCFTQNRSLVILRHEKTPYHIINDQKPSVKFFHIFGSLCYIVRDGENLDKMKEKGDACIFVGYSTQSRAYRVFNKRTRVIVESIYVNFDGLPHMVSDHVSSDPAQQCPKTELEHNSLSPGPQCVSLCQILHCLLILLQLVEIILFIVDSGCSKHMTGNLKLLINFVEKFLGTIKFGNDQIAPILGYEDLGNDPLIGSRGTDLYSISLQDTTSPNPNCLMAKATSSQAWLWHRRLSHLNFDTINLLSKNDIVIGLPKLKFVKDHLCSSCELGKAKQKSFQSNITPSSKRLLQLLHMDLCGPMRVESINRRKYVLVIVDDYSRYTWTHFLRSKDEIPKVLINFLRLVQRGLHAKVRTVRTDKGTEFLNKTLHAYFAAESIKHQMSVARTPEQNGVVERRNRTLVKAARTMLSAVKVPLDGENLDKMKEKDRPLEQVIGNPSQSVRTRRQLESDGEMCMFALTVS